MEVFFLRCLPPPTVGAGSDLDLKTLLRYLRPTSGLERRMTLQHKHDLDSLDHLKMTKNVTHRNIR